jgi:hypothetical protein
LKYWNDGWHEITKTKEYEIRKRRTGNLSPFSYFMDLLKIPVYLYFRFAFSAETVIWTGSFLT